MSFKLNNTFVIAPAGLGRFQRPTILALCVNEYGNFASNIGYFFASRNLREH